MNEKNIRPITVNNCEEVWNIKDVLLSLEHYRQNRIIVLGGDILDTQFKHTYDSWYYNPDNTKDTMSNVNNSIQKATKYITEYINRNGNNYYVTIVLNR